MSRAIGVEKKLLTAFIIIIGGIVFLFFPVSLPFGVGDGDFRAYWSSTYLLARGEDYSDSAKVGNVQRSLTGWNQPETVYAWFSPIGNLVLLPYILLPFQRATYYWLLTNIVLLFFSTILLWEKTTGKIWIPVIFIFSFSITITLLASGQINTLEVLGLALFLALTKSGNFYAAGACLVFTTIKPHLVILTLPLLILDLLRKKQWKTLIGFTSTLLVCSAILFFINPNWLAGFWQVITSGMSSIRQTPTLNGLLVIVGLYKLGKWIWVITLLFGIAYWLKHGENWDLRAFIDRSVTVGLIVSPLGWGYDQIMLIFPLFSILEWILKGQLTKTDVTLILTTLIAANFITYYQRVVTVNDLWFFWVPILVAIIYIYAWQRRQVTLPGLLQAKLEHGNK